MKRLPVALLLGLLSPFMALGFLAKFAVLCFRFGWDVADEIVERFCED